jgi:hypothetical protein
MRTVLRRVLPAHMLPQVIVVDRWPLMPNGKLDRRALPAPAVASSAEAYRAPRTDTERLLCGLFEQLLGVARVGVDDDFFALGGHSFAAIRLRSRIQSALDVDVPVRDIFSTGSVRELAAVVDVIAAASRAPEVAETPVAVTVKYL